MDGLSGKHFRLCNSVSFVAVLVKGLQSQFGCARLVILCGFGSFSVIVFCFVFLFMYFSFSSELLFDSIGYGSLPACLHDCFHCLPAWLFPLPACLHLALLPATSHGCYHWDPCTPLFPWPPLCTGPLTNCRLYCTPRFCRQVSHAFPAGQPAQEFCAGYTGGGRRWAWGVASSWAHACALHEHLHASCWVAVGGQGHSGKCSPFLLKQHFVVFTDSQLQTVLKYR